MTPEFIILRKEAGKENGNVSSLLLAALGTDDRKEISFREWKGVGVSQEFRTEQTELQDAS